MRAGALLKFTVFIILLISISAPAFSLTKPLNYSFERSPTERSYCYANTTDVNSPTGWDFNTMGASVDLIEGHCYPYTALPWYVSPHHDRNWSTQGSYSYVFAIGNSATINTKYLRILPTDVNILEYSKIILDYNAYLPNTVSGTTYTFNVFTVGKTGAVCDSNTVTLTTQYNSSIVLNKMLNICSDTNGLAFSITQAGGSGTSQIFQIDNIRLMGLTSQMIYVLEPAQPLGVNESFQMGAYLKDSNGEYITTADVNLVIGSNAYPMSLSGDTYYFTHPGLAQGAYNYAIRVKAFGVTKDKNATLRVEKKEYQYLTFTPIQNSNNWEYGSIIIRPDDEIDEIIFRVDSNSTATQNPNFKIKNSLNDGRQYFIYTSEDGTSWAFNDSLTYGATIDTPIQKIYNQSEQIYDHSFTDTLVPEETKFYKLIYQHPYKYWQTIAFNPEWFSQLEPSIDDINGFLNDNYSVSSYSNIYSYFTNPIPDTYVNLPDVYELQFTAWADTNNIAIMQIGQVTDGVESLTSLTLSSTPKRYSLTINPSNRNSLVLLKSSASSPYQIYMTDYALVARAYFVKRLEIRDEMGEFLQSILKNGYSSQYLQEGYPFMLSTEAYDRNGDLRTLTVNGFFDTNAASNRVKQQIFYMTTSEQATEEYTLNFNELFDPIIDTSGSATSPATPRNLIIEARLTDRLGQVVAIQSLPVVFLQFPYFPNDLIMDYIPTEKRKGKNPDGIFTIETTRPETIEGFDIRIYSDTNTVSSPNYQAKIYNGKDFGCYDFKCAFRLKIEDWLFEDANKTTVTIFALINTETLNQSNHLTREDKYFMVSPIEFKQAKILQTLERPSNTYLPTENIPLVMVLGDSEADDLTAKLDVYIQLQNCDGNVSPTCTTQTTKYKPSGVLYDQTNNNNYYFFNELFTLDNGALLPDGNYISFVGTIADKTGARTQIQPLLTSRCESQFLIGADVFGSLIWATTLKDVGGSQIETKCTNGASPAIVSTDLNANQKQYLRINSGYIRSSPTIDAFSCTKNANYAEDQICFVMFNLAEKPIDNIRLRISNNNSNTKEKGATRQFYEINIPPEYIAMNDIALIARELDSNRLLTSATLADVIFNALNYLKPAHLTFNNVNYASDIDKAIISFYSQALDLNAAFQAGGKKQMIIIALNKLNFINAYDYRYNLTEDPEDYEFFDMKNFIKYAKENELILPKTKASARLYVNSITPLAVIPLDDYLIINEKPSESQADTNNVNTKIIPTNIRLDTSLVLFYNNYSEYVQENGYLIYNKVISDNAAPINVFREEANKFISSPISYFIDWLTYNSVIIFMVLVFFISLGMVWSLFTKGRL